MSENPEGKPIISFRVNPELKEAIDLAVKHLDYGTRTEFLEDCIEFKIQSIMREGVNS